MNKHIAFILSLLFTGFNSSAQLYIPSGASINMGGNAILYSGSDFINKGLVNGGMGTLICNSHLLDSGTVNGASSLLSFTGSFDQQAVFGSSSLKRVSINKSSGNVNFLSTIPSISDSLLLVKGLAVINNQNLITKAIGGGSAVSYVKTMGTGRLKMPLASGQTKAFHVGLSSYNQVEVSNNSGNSDSVGVRVMDEVYSQGATGNAISRGRVKRTWEIQSNNGNSGAGYTMKFYWDGASALSLSNPALFAFTGSQWQELNGNTIISGNSLTYSGYKGNAVLFSVQQSCGITTTSISNTICPSQLPYIWNGQSIIQSGIYTWAGTNMSGCDSTVILNLTVKTINSNFISQDTILACGLSYALNAGPGYDTYNSCTPKLITIFVDFFN